MNSPYPINIKFKLNSSALLVKGATRALVCDVERNEYFPIPISLYYILKDNEAQTIEKIINYYSKGDIQIEDTIKEYFDFLIAKDLIFFSKFTQLYSPLDLEWDFPATISNAIIDLGIDNISYIKAVISQLDKLNCSSLQLRFFDVVEDINLFDNLLNCFDDSIVENIDIFVKYQFELQNELERLVIKYPRINSLTIYNHPNHKGFEPLNQKGRGKLFTYPKNITIHSCGVVKPFYFITNIQHVAEAQKHNTCLNRKITIDTEGYIRNCPSMKEHYGNIKDTTLQEALQHPDFKKYWFINKDQIAVCKDCEFRFVCTDCRAYIENPDDMYSKPLKCGYNPYTCEWEEWSINPLKQKAIDHYGLRNII